jgi:DNA-binding CsgD family transcriptional regulator
MIGCDQEATATLRTDEVQARADPNLRRTGIPPIGLLPWGAHLCMFYETPEDLIDAQADYFEAGLADNESCIWIVSEPIDVGRAIAHMRNVIAGFDDYLAASAIELIPGDEWYLRGGTLDPRRVIAGWFAKLDEALADGFAGLRVSGNAFWGQTDLWGSFSEYEEELHRSLEGRRVIASCTYPLRATRAVDLLDMARFHHVAVARRNGKWESLESSELASARRDVTIASHNIEMLSRPFPGHDRLTPREHVTLAEIVKGASSKQVARTLGISPRTVEFHRANIMRKLGAGNVAELLAIVFGTG